jgi:L-cysteine S-thiosulfotransferase
MHSRVRKTPVIKTSRRPFGAALFLIAVLSAPFSNSVFAQPAAPNTASQIAKGRAIFLDERKGNCAACHKAPNDADVKTKSNIGMPLEAIKARYPDRAKLRDAIWDLSKSVPNTIMPPYGKNRILSDDEIDALVIYLETI